MVQIDLAANEIEILIDVLENDLSDLRMEISHTDRLDFREKLKVKKGVLTTVLDALKTEK